MEDSIEFIMVLPGQTAKQYRKQFCVIIKRYFGGDQSLHAEIEANAASSHPIAQMARESLDVQAPASPELVGFKRRRQELELLKMEEEIKGMTQARILGLKSEMEQLSDPSNSKLDEPTRQMFKDTLQSLLMHENRPAPKRVGHIAKPLPDIVKRFLCSLVGTNVTQIGAREFHKKYMEYHAATNSKGPAECMLQEKLFFQTVRDFPGVVRTKGKTSMVYRLDHAAIQQAGQ